MSEPQRPLWQSPLLLIAIVVACGGLIASLSPTWGAGGEARAAGPDFIAERADSICGLDNVQVLSSPALVRHADLMDATAERRRMSAEKIDPASALGQILETKARRRVHAACRTVMAQQGHCSIWKKISRADGRAVPDITTEVLAVLDSADPESKSS